MRETRVSLPLASLIGPMGGLLGTGIGLLLSGRFSRRRRRRIGRSFVVVGAASTIALAYGLFRTRTERTRLTTVIERPPRSPNGNPRVTAEEGLMAD